VLLKDTVNVTVPLPVPEEPVCTVMKLSLDTAVHAHPVPAVTLIVVPDCAFLFRLCDVGLMENVQPLLWVTVCVWSAMAIVPTRCGPVLAAVVNPTVPLPVPLAPLVIVIHVVVVDDVQAHPEGIVSATVGAAPPPAPTVCDCGLIDPGHAPLCVTVYGRPAMVIVPTRLVVFGFAMKSKPTVPLPVPLAPLVIVIHGVVVDAVHAQPDGIVTAMGVADPAVAGTVCDAGLNDAGHEPGCVTVCV